MDIDEFFEHLDEHYPYRVPTEEYDTPLQARIDTWLFGRGIDYQDFFCAGYKGKMDERVYCFREGKDAMMFKLVFG